MLVAVHKNNIEPEWEKAIDINTLAVRIACMKIVKYVPCRACTLSKSRFFNTFKKKDLLSESHHQKPTCMMGHTVI